MGKFVIDPGHGGSQPGATYNGIKESDITLSIALLVAALLRQAGHFVLLTRDHDITVPLEDRVHMINEFEADAFISIHCNATLEHNSKGIEAFYRDDLDKSLAIAIQKPLSQMTGLKDRGVFQDIGQLKKRLAVLNDSANIPATLVEIGFLDNAEDREYMTNNLTSIAEIISDAAHGWIVQRGV